jgi:hypothetical protein
VTLVLALQLSTAFGSTSEIAACYSAAEAAFPSAQMSVYVEGVLTLPTTSDLDAVMQAVAAADNSDDISVTRNIAGKNALRQAMDCIFDTDNITWSAVRLNQQDTQLQVRPHGFELTLSGVTEYLENVSLDTTSSVVTIAYHRAGVGACRTVAFDVVPYGPTDFYASEDDSGSGPPAGGTTTNTCTGSDCEKCAYNDDGCDCRKPAGDSPVCNHTTSTTTPNLGGSGAGSTASVTL